MGCIASVVALLTLLSSVSMVGVAEQIGALRLSGSQTYVIEDADVVLTGSVEVRGSASLVIRNSTVKLSQEFHEENNWLFQDTASLVLVDSKILSPFTHTIAFLGESHGEIHDSTLNAAFVTLGEGAVVDIRDSSIQHLSPDLVNNGKHPSRDCILHVLRSSLHELSFGVTGNAIGTVASMKPGTLSSWNLSQVANAGMSVELTDVSVGNINWLIGGSSDLTLVDCHLWQLGVIDSGKARVQDSTVGQATLVFAAGQHITLRGLTSGETVSDWSLRDADPSTNIPFDYILRNSRVGGWYLRNRGATLTLEDCDLSGSRLRPEFDSVAATTRVVRCYVDELMLWWSYGHLDFEDTVVHHIITPVESSTFISGSLRIEQSWLMENWGAWQSSYIRREYPVLIQDEDGQPLANEALILMSPSERIVWQGSSGSDGRAEFQLSFGDINFNDVWTLVVGDGATSIPVSFLSDTPLTNVTIRQASLDDSVESKAVTASSGTRGVLDCDGLVGSDWDNSKLTTRDVSGDAHPPERDIVALFARVDDAYLHVRLDLAAPPIPQVRYSVNLRPIASSESYSLHAGGEGMWGPSGFICRIEYALGDVVEFAVPLDVLDQLGLQQFEISADTRAFGAGWVDRYDDIPRRQFRLD